MAVEVARSLLVWARSSSSPARAAAIVAPQMAAIGTPASRMVVSVRVTAASGYAPSHRSPPGSRSRRTAAGSSPSSERSGTIDNPPMDRTGAVENPTVTTSSPPDRRSSASANAGSQSAKPSNTSR